LLQAKRDNQPGFNIDLDFILLADGVGIAWGGGSFIGLQFCSFLCGEY